jgi:hypothetical protein
MEHLNRTAKEALGQHSHLNPRSVKRVGNCVGLFQNVCDTATGAHPSSGKNVCASEATDLQKIIRQLLVSKMFIKTGNRCHLGFENSIGEV